MNTAMRFVCGLAISALPATSAYAISSYSLTGLGNLGGQSFARGLNDKDQVVGEAMLPNGNEVAFLWQQSTGMVSLGMLPGDDQSGASSIDNTGQIAGGSQGNREIQVQGFLWQPQSGMIDIGAGTNMVIEPFGINQQGRIYGTSSVGGFTYSAATGFTQASIPGTTVDAIYALNSSGQMVIPNHDNADTGALFYSPGQGLFPIQNNLGWDVSVISGINEHGTVVGDIPTPVTGDPQAFVWSQSAGMGVLTSDPNDASWAEDINDLGQVVGGARFDGQPFFPFLYENGTMYDLMWYLDDTATDWSNLNLTAINDNGDIVGYGFHNGQEEAFLLTPTATTSIPEPAAILLAPGFCLLASFRRRA